jgi:hypothetical protein
MKTGTLRLGLSLMVVIGCWANQLPAQEILVVPTVEYEPEHHEPRGLPLPPRPQPAPANHLVCRVLNSHGMACQADPYTIAASSWHYEMRFVFGSSRWFLAQPCVPGKCCGDR